MNKQLKASKQCQHINYSIHTFYESVYDGVLLWFVVGAMLTLGVGVAGGCVGVWGAGVTWVYVMKGVDGEEKRDACSQYISHGAC